MRPKISKGFKVGKNSHVGMVVYENGIDKNSTIKSQQ